MIARCISASTFSRIHLARTSSSFLLAARATIRKSLNLLHRLKSEAPPLNGNNREALEPHFSSGDIGASAASEQPLTPVAAENKSFNLNSMQLLRIRS